MSKVGIIQQVFRASKWVPLVYPAIFNQTFKDFTLYVQIVDDDGNSKEYIKQNFPQAVILEPGYNIGFARGHNEIFASTDHEFYQLVNPDLIMEPDYIEKLLKEFEDPTVGSAEGKLYQYLFDSNTKTDILDGTGVIIYKTGRARNRGQQQKDIGQYDKEINIASVDGAAPMYRKTALEAVSFMGIDGRKQYFDESFHSYWEDVDLGWRMFNQGFKARFVPEAIAYHGRTSSSSRDGYKNVFGFIKHHNKFSLWVKRLNYRNHILMYIKNSPKFYWKFFAREFFMLGFILLLETKTLGIVPDLLKNLPKAFKTRKELEKNRKISLKEAESIFSKHPTDL
jgi:GT2 family glycosyltransferase